jgi:hypothetical protein
MSGQPPHLPGRRLSQEGGGLYRGASLRHGCCSEFEGMPVTLVRSIIVVGAFALAACGSSTSLHTGRSDGGVGIGGATGQAGINGTAGSGAPGQAGATDSGGTGGAMSEAGVAATPTMDAGQCGYAAGVGDASPGTCSVARANIYCTYPTLGESCGCLTDDATCAGCPAGATCTDQCNANEYAVSCDHKVPSAVPPPACRVLELDEDDAYYCCPCL